MDQAALFIKCNAIAENGVIVLLKLFGILPVFDLLQCRCAAFFQSIQFFAILCLKENDLRSVGMEHDNIAAALAVFPVGFYLIAGARMPVRKA